jgi:hypothetical protein
MFFQKNTEQFIAWSITPDAMRFHPKNFTLWNNSIDWLYYNSLLQNNKSVLKYYKSA